MIGGFRYTAMGANFSPDGRYRYRLWREWRGTHADNHWEWLTDQNGKRAVDGAGYPLGEPKACVFIMLNPSTADDLEDDPTIRRCVGFARAWNYERLEVVNLFAHRATDPLELLIMHCKDDPVGPENQRYIRQVTINAGIIICAWGAIGRHLGQDQTVLGWISRPCFALHITKNGDPGHPLYLPSSSVPLPFSNIARKT